jgi:hypothetical protein
MPGKLWQVCGIDSGRTATRVADDAPFAKERKNDAEHE